MKKQMTRLHELKIAIELFFCLWQSQSLPIDAINIPCLLNCVCVQ